jgi:iron-sulfur cluster repair protein YtfE (RIC family)
MKAFGNPLTSGSRESVNAWIAYLRDDSHYYLRQMLAKLDRLTERIGREKLVPPRLMDWLQREFLAMEDRLETHLAKQECRLFPMICKLTLAGVEKHSARDLGESLREAMDLATLENRELLTEIERVQMGLCNPVWADKGPLVEKLIDDLRELEEQLANYVSLEEAVLFPQVQEMLPVLRSAKDRAALVLH